VISQKSSNGRTAAQAANSGMRGSSNSVLINRLQEILRGRNTIYEFSFDAFTADLFRQFCAELKIRCLGAKAPTSHRNAKQAKNERRAPGDALHDRGWKTPQDA
jgi:hypothetical protein